MADISIEVQATRSVATVSIPSTIAKGLLIPLVTVVLWGIAAHFELASSRLLVSPVDVIRAAFVDDTGKGVWLATLTSLVRMLVGFAIGAGLGLATGIFTGSVRPADKSLSPTLNALRQITLFAWMPLLTGWFGNGEMTRIVYIALSAFFPVAFSVHEGIRKIPAGYLEVASVLRLRRMRRLRRLVIPAAMPSLCTGLQVGLLTAWLGTVSAEYVIGVTDGLGSIIVFGREQFRMDIVLLAVLFLSIVGYAIALLSTRARGYLLRNHGIAQ